MVGISVGISVVGISVVKYVGISVVTIIEISVSGVGTAQ